MHYKEAEHYSKTEMSELEKAEVFEQQPKSNDNKNYTYMFLQN